MGHNQLREGEGVEDSVLRCLLRYRVRPDMIEFLYVPLNLYWKKVDKKKGTIKERGRVVVVFVRYSQFPLLLFTSFSNVNSPLLDMKCTK